MGQHEKECSAPSRKGAQVLEVLKSKEAKHKEELKIYRNIVGLLSYEKITFNGELDVSSNGFNFKFLRNLSS